MSLSVQVCKKLLDLTAYLIDRIPWLSSVFLMEKMRRHGLPDGLAS